MIPLAIMLTGCSSKSVTTPTLIPTYITVEKPVKIKISRPNRPVLNPSQPLPIYLNEVLVYTSTLEKIIDNTGR